MARVIGVGNEKGGSGKTSTAYPLAVDLKARGNTVVLIDNDPQKGSYRWKIGSKYPDLTPMVAPIENPLTKQDIEVFRTADYIIVDGAPGFGNDPRLRACHDFLNELSISDSVDDQTKKYMKERLRKIFGFTGTITAKLTALVKISDLFIIPTLASLQDLEPTVNLVRNIVEPYHTAHGKPGYKVLLTDSDEKTKLYGAVREYMDRQNIPTFNAYIKHREIYRQATTDGFTVIENKADEKATKETIQLTDEILTFFGEQKNVQS